VVRFRADARTRAGRRSSEQTLAEDTRVDVAMIGTICRRRRTFAN